MDPDAIIPPFIEPEVIPSYQLHVFSMLLVVDTGNDPELVPDAKFFEWPL
jgi:hypothetical protein